MHQLATLGWDDVLADALADLAPSAVPARVVRVDRGAVDLLAGTDADVRPLRARVRGDSVVATGDWVTLTDLLDPWVEHVLPRRTAIVRTGPSGRSDGQVLAANVDTVVVTVPVHPEPKAGLVERLVALAWESGATPLVAMTKADLGEAAAVAADLAEAAPGVPIEPVSVLTPDGLDPLRPHLQPGRTLCLLGRSGAGKSSLANALIGAEVFATTDIRGDGKGRHTTTHRELVQLPSGALLIDTPGLRGAGLWVGDTGLDRTFAEIEELVETCRFTDCTHVAEPGCQLLAAVDDGRVSERRLASWRKLQRESEWIAARTDARLRAERRRTWKLLQAEVRRSGRVRP